MYAIRSYYVDVPTVTNMLGIIEPSLLEQLISDIIAKDQGKILGRNNFV